MSKLLIVNADDFGHTQGVSAGILDAHRRGIVTSTTALMNKPGVESALQKARQICPGLGLGVHLVLTAGRPILPPAVIPSLVDKKGQFRGLKELITGLDSLELSEVRAEWMAQIDLFVKATGQKPDHLDAHHFCSCLSPALFELMLNLAGKLSVPIRMPFRDGSEFVIGDLPEKERNSILEAYPHLLEHFHQPFPRNFITSFYGQGISILSLKNILEHLPEGSSELMCHPGYADDELKSNSNYSSMREREHKVLTNDRIKTCLLEQGIKLIGFAQLPYK